MDPRIGKVIKKGKELFYAYPRSYSLPPVFGTLEYIQAVLAEADLG